MRACHVLFVALIAGCFSAPAAVSAQVEQIDVWVDPGHGGGDPGNLPADNDSDHNESQISIQQSGALLTSLLNLGYNTALTRNADMFMTKPRRWKISNGSAANDVGFQATSQVFISIHMNSNPSRDTGPRGTETYYSPAKLRLKAKDAYRADSSFAATVHPRLMANAAAAFIGCNSNRGVKTALHTITKRSEVPSILVEVCFLTNPCQLTYIVQANKQAVIAEGIAAGVSFYIQPLGAITPPKTSIALWDGATYAPAIEGQSGIWSRTTFSIQSSTEGFEGGTFPPTGWTLTTLGAPSPYRWHRTTDPLFVGAGAGGALVRGQAPGAVDEWLISPKVLVTSAEHAVKFTWAGNQLFASAVNATCAVRPVGSMTWTTLWSLLNEPLGGEWDFRQQSLDLATWVGDSVQVAFRVAGTNGADFMIDDVSFGSFPPTTAPANDLCANAASLPSGHFSLNGSTCYAANNMAPPSAGACVADEFTGADVFYKFNAVAGDSMDISVIGNWFPVAYVVSGCDSAASSCVGSTPSLETADQFTGTTSIVFPSTGTYFLVVDGLEGECGDFALAGFVRGLTTGVELGDLSSTRLALTSFPNPVHGNVVFSGTIPLGPSTGGRLTIHDASGRLVTSLEAVPTSGRFQVEWDGRDANGSRAAAGVYFARFAVAGESVQRTVILTK